MPVGKRVLKPHGTPAAVARHRRAKEPLCELCALVEHEHNAARWAVEKAERDEALTAVRRKH